MASFRNFAPSQEPAVWVGALVLILQSVQKYLNHEPLDADWTQQLLVALGALVIRQSVTPVTAGPPSLGSSFPSPGEEGTMSAGLAQSERKP